MANLKSRINALWPWLREIWHVWVSLAVIAIALLVALRPQTTEPVIRITGLILQLFGIGTIIWGISETRALFGHPSVLKQTREWLARFPLFRRHVVMAASGGAFSAATVRGRAHVTHSLGENPTVELRLSSLEENIKLVNQRIDQFQHEFDTETQNTKTLVKNEAQERQSEDQIIREKLEATGTGGVHISAIGASWLFVGSILSSTAVEIASYLK